MNYNILYLCLVFSILFSGCSYKVSERTINITNSNKMDLPFPSASLEKTLAERRSASNSINLHKVLNDFYGEWKGVKYRYGGNSKNGIDCSAFIQKAYRDKLNIKIPRTTLLQSKIGKQINKSQLELGDLVFFRTGKNSRHVGIYMENGNFMHASTSKGVIISKLNNIYFNKHYWKAQRIIY